VPRVKCRAVRFCVGRECVEVQCVRNDLKERRTKREGGDVSAHQGPFYSFILARGLIFYTRSLLWARVKCESYIYLRE
jgi:hypothetical protein